MKQYDAKEGEYLPISETGTIIILTVEELRDIWEEATDEAWRDARPSVRYEKPDRLHGFDGYLESKGIKI
jgi:hypothetical protein